MVVFKARFDNMALTEHNHDCSQLEIIYLHFVFIDTTTAVHCSTKYQHEFNYFLVYHEVALAGKNKVCIKFQPFLEKVEQLP